VIREPRPAVRRHRDVSGLRVLEAGGLVVALVTGCGSTGVLIGQRPPSTSPSSTVPPAPAANKRKTEAEAAHLLALIVTPPGSVKLSANPSPAILSGPPLGTPRSTPLIDDSAFWKVSMSMTDTLAWFTAHPPGGLPSSGSGISLSSNVITNTGYSYSIPDSSAWINAELEVDVAPFGSSTSQVRGDGLALWLDSSS
jgi:hypothetical protein